MSDSEMRYFSKDGKDYVVRFFDCENSRDLRDLVLIVESPGAQRWMDNVGNLSFSSYRRWMDEKGEDDSFLFAIADPRDNISEDDRVHGFVYFYPSKIQPDSLEISYAKRPGAPAGLTAPAIETAIKFVYDNLSEKRPWVVPGLKLLAEIESGNVSSIKVAERAGFVMVRDFDRENNGLWAREIGPGQLVEKRVEEIGRGSLDKLGRVRQLNGSYCGPAALQILLSHFGIQADQNMLVDAATTRKHVMITGMSIELLAEAVKNTYPAYSLWVKRDSTIMDVEKMVREFNYPVGVDWQGVFEKNEYHDPYIADDDYSEMDKMVRGDEGHYCVITDVDMTKNFVRMMDPYGHYAEQDRFYEVHEFLNRWWDDRTDKLPDGSKKYVFEKRLMFVVVPKSVRIPETMGMVEI